MILGRSVATGRAVINRSDALTLLVPDGSVKVAIVITVALVDSENATVKVALIVADLGGFNRGGFHSAAMLHQKIKKVELFLPENESQQFLFAAQAPVPYPSATFSGLTVVRLFRIAPLLPPCKHCTIFRAKRKGAKRPISLIIN